MRTHRKPAPKPRRPHARRSAFSIEPVESRLLMASLGFIGGYATHAGGAAATGATIQLFNGGSSTVPVATTSPNSDGYYHFDNLTPGVYQVAEVESGYATSAVGASTTINPATAINSGTAIQVTVVDPSTQTVQVTRNADPYTPALAYYNVANGPFNGYTNVGDTTHQYDLSLSGNAGNIGRIFSVCTDLYHGVNQGAVYQTTPSPNPLAAPPPTPPATSAANVGRIGYLYNHFGTTAASDPKVGAGLQLAVWELLYDSTDDLYAGNFALNATGNDPAVVAAANGFLAASAGKSEDAYFLDVRTASGDTGGQSMIATDLLNFTSSVVPAVTLSGTVYEDRDAGGSLTGADVGIGGVTLTLVDGTNAVIATTTTSTVAGSLGTYSFTKTTGGQPIPPGTYKVTENQPAGYLQGSNTVGTVAGVADGSLVPTDMIGSIVLTSGQSSVANNFGEVKPVTISGNVYEDRDAGGTLTGADAPIPGTTLTLSGTNNLGLAASATTIVKADGTYSFTVDGSNRPLAPGTYKVSETQPNIPGSSPATPYLQRSNTVGTVNNATDGALVPTDMIGSIVLKSGQSSVANNFGEVKPGSISGFVYLDANNNGVKDGGSTPEAGIGGVKVTSTAVINGVTLSTSVVTASDGSYSIPNLYPGAYTLTETNVPAAYQPDVTNTGSLTGVAVVAGANTPNQNFGELLYMPGCDCPIASVCYTDYGPCGTSTFSDLGGNTHQGDQVTATITVTSPVTITLVSYTATSNFDLTKQAVFSVDTQTFGPGKHSLTVTIPNGYYQIDLVCGGAITRFDPANNVTYHGQNRFIDSDNGGCQVVGGPAALAGFTGTVFSDGNGDGVVGPGDAGIGGVSVTLTGTDVTGRQVTETRVTAPDGTYSFLGLQPGTYAVREATPSGYVTTRNTVGTVKNVADGKLSSSSTDTITSIALAAGNSGSGYNFGEQKVTSCPLGCTQTASVDWWAGSSGQSLIKSLNGGPTATKLGHWLATECPNLFGSLDGKTNAQVASYYVSQYSKCWTSANAEILATALAAYATDTNLAGCNAASQYGFTMTAGGSGNCTVDVGTSMSCYGGPKGRVTLLQLLDFVDDESCNGQLAGGNWWEQFSVACLFDQINGCSRVG